MKLAHIFLFQNCHKQIKEFTFKVPYAPINRKAIKVKTQTKYPLPMFNFVQLHTSIADKKNKLHFESNEWKDR